MATEIDGLQISISADVSKAEKSIDNLINTLGKLQKSLVKTDIKETGISDMSDEFNGAEKAIIASSKNISRNISKAMFSSKNSFDSFMKSIANVGKNKTFNGFAGDLPEEITKIERKLDSLLAKEERFNKLGQNVDSKGFRALQYDLAETLNYLDNLYAAQEKKQSKLIASDFFEKKLSMHDKNLEEKAEIEIDADTTEAEKEIDNFIKSVQKKRLTNFPRYHLDTSGLDALMKSEPAQIAKSIKDTENVTIPLEQTVNKLENASNAIKQFADLLKTVGFKEASGGINQIGGAIGTIATGAKGATGALAGFSKAIPYIGAVVTILGVLGGAITFTVKGIKGIASKMQNAFKKVSNTISNVVKSLFGLGSATDNTQTLLGKAFNRVFQTLKSGLISRAVTTTVNSIGDAFKELALYSQNIGTPFNKNISRIVADFKWLGRTIATAFEPIINVVTPVIDFLVSKLVSAINIINQFFNALTGGGTYTEAKYQVDDYATSVNGASAAQSKLNKQLHKLDELNVITKSDGSGSGGGASGGGQPYETKPIGSNVSLLAQRLKESWEKADFSWFGALFAGKLSGELDKIDWNTIKGTAEKVGKSLATLINGFITFPDMGTKIGNAIGEAINTFISGIDGFIGNLDWKSVGTFIGDMINGALNTVEWTKILNIANNLGKGLADAINNLANTEALSNCSKAIGSFITSAVSGAWSFVTNLDFKQLGTEISNGINKAIGEMATKDSTGKTGWQKLGETLSAGISGLADMISEALDGIDWDLVGSSVIQFLTGIDWLGLLKSAITLKDKLQEGLFEVIKIAIAAIGTPQLDFAFEIGTKIADFTQKVKDFVAGIPEGASEILAKLKGDVTQSFTDLKSKWDKLGTKGKDVVAKAKGSIKKSFTTLKDKWDKVKNKSSTVKAYAKNMSSTVLDTLSNAWDKFHDIKATLTAKFNDFFSAPLKKAWNAIAGSINKGIDILNKVPGINITNIPTFATGGFPEDGWFRANHGEIMGKFDNGQSVVANNMQITQGISDAVQRGNQQLVSYLQQEVNELRQQNEYLRTIASKEFGITEKQIGQASQRFARDYSNRTGKPAFI